jgi:DeoR family fructose operon transcriptional repressor
MHWAARAEEPIPVLPPVSIFRRDEMLQEERVIRIKALLDSFVRMSTDQLAQELDVSRETVRRDILQLEAQGTLRRVHGGVVATALQLEPPFVERQRIRAREKRAIAHAVLPLLTSGQTLLLDAGSTTGILADAIATVAGLTVITNSISIALKLTAAKPSRPRPGSEIILLGGQPHGEVQATYGVATVNDIARYHADVAILSPVGLSAAHGATSYEHHEVAVAQAMMRQAKRLVIIADHSKIGVTSRVTYAPATQIDTIVTNRNAANDRELRLLRKAGAQVVLA